MARTLSCIEPRDSRALYVVRAEVRCGPWLGVIRTTFESLLNVLKNTCHSPQLHSKSVSRVGTLLFFLRPCVQRWSWVSESQPAVEKLLQLRSCARCPPKTSMRCPKRKKLAKIFTLNLHFFFAGLWPALKRSSMPENSRFSSSTCGQRLEIPKEKRSSVSKNSSWSIRASLPMLG